MTDEELVAHHDALCKQDAEHWFDVIAKQMDEEDDPKQMEQLRAPNALMNAALWYATNGIAIFPITPRKKAPPLVQWKTEATTDVAVVRRWWTKTPDANIGIKTGTVFDVIDLDGWEAYVLWSSMPQELRPPILGAVLTPRGRHYFIPADPEKTIETGMAGGWDYRGAGGYVVAPPSQNVDGKFYRWLQPPTWLTK